jgi:hypothetical protein
MAYERAVGHEWPTFDAYITVDEAKVKVPITTSFCGRLETHFTFPEAPVTVGSNA